jgi:hypothetical protein
MKGTIAALGLIGLIIFFAGGSVCLAQADAAPASRNSIFAELLGNGGVYSINVERLLTDHLGLRVGYAAWDSNLFGILDAVRDQYKTVPVTVSYLLGGGERKLELGGGMVFGRFRDFDGTSSFRSLTGIIGYRSQPPEGGYLFRAGLTPFYALDDDEDDAYPDTGFTWSAGVSFGYTF